MLTPPPAFITPARIALAAVAAITAIATPPAIAEVDGVQRILGPGVAARAAVTLITAALAVALAHRALRARLPLHARVWLIAGGAGFGLLAAVLGYTAAVLCGGSRIPYQEEAQMILLGAMVFGAPLGAAFGVVFGPVVVSASIARRKPAHDSVDRVTFAAGATIAAVCAAAARLAAAPLAHAALGAASTAVALAAAVRLVTRVRLLQKARAGALPGLTIERRAGREDDDALLPLVPTARRPAGVLVAAGTIAPYRGERGAVRIALVPAPEQAFSRPVRRLIGAALREIGATILSVPAAAFGLTLVGFTCALLLAASGAVGR